MKTALNRAGYSQLYWGVYEGGLLVETCLEYLDGEARTINPKKRCREPPPHPTSVWEFAKNFLIPPRHRGRVFMFILSDRVTLDESMAAPYEEGAGLRLMSIAPVPELCHTEMYPRARLWRLVYEYEFPTGETGPRFVRPGALPGPRGIVDHLQESGLATEL